VATADTASLSLAQKTASTGLLGFTRSKKSLEQPVSDNPNTAAIVYLLIKNFIYI
jgi:hypothetical protein